MTELIKTWIQIGKRNPWIRQVGSGNPEDVCAFEKPFWLTTSLTSNTLRVKVPVQIPLLSFEKVKSI